MSDIEYLLENGADVNTKNDKHFSLLMSAARNNDLEAISTLIRYGAKINSKDLHGFTALDYAIEQNHLDSVKLLVNSGAIITDNSYMLAVNKNLKDIAKYFDTLDDDKQIFLKNKKR